MTRRWTLPGLASATLVTALCVTGSARAEYPAPAPYVGVFGGGSLPLRDWDLGKDTHSDTKRPDGASAMVGGRIGVQILRQLAVEGEVGFLPVTSTIGGTNKVLSYSVNGYYQILRGDWTPYVGLGIGAFHNTSGDLGKDAEQRTHLGVGLRGMLTPWLALRAEAREVTTDGFDKTGAHMLEGHAGLDVFLAQVPKPVNDRDGDGVIEGQDACPTEPGKAEHRGCPDKDNDGIIDMHDKCPDVAGVEQFIGCPDSDGDGVADTSDECPEKRGTKRTQGCPDRDDDGVGDSVDKCPDLAGPEDQKGCPDEDRDGILDPEDKCPQVTGPKETAGCPDLDGDEVADKDDKCPKEPGLKDHQGCLPDAAKKFTGAIKGITFDTGSAKIQPQSFKVLDQAVAVLKQYEGMSLRIEGHTDNQGKSEANQKLSQDRAASVKAYMVSKGIADSRLESAGFGDSRPAMPNATPAGRMANRRIEFVLIRAK